MKLRSVLVLMLGTIVCQSACSDRAVPPSSSLLPSKPLPKWAKTFEQECDIAEIDTNSQASTARFVRFVFVGTVEGAFGDAIIERGGTRALYRYWGANRSPLVLTTGPRVKVAGVATHDYRNNGPPTLIAGCDGEVAWSIGGVCQFGTWQSELASMVQCVDIVRERKAAQPRAVRLTRVDDSGVGHWLAHAPFHAMELYRCGTCQAPLESLHSVPREVVEDSLFGRPLDRLSMLARHHCGRLDSHELSLETCLTEDWDYHFAESSDHNRILLAVDSRMVIMGLWPYAVDFRYGAISIADDAPPRDEIFSLEWNQRYADDIEAARQRSFK